MIIQLVNKTFSFLICRPSGLKMPKKLKFFLHVFITYFSVITGSISFIKKSIDNFRTRTQLLKYRILHFFTCSRNLRGQIGQILYIRMICLAIPTRFSSKQPAVLLPSIIPSGSVLFCFCKLGYLMWKIVFESSHLKLVRPKMAKVA